MHAVVFPERAAEHSDVAEFLYERIDAGLKHLRDERPAGSGLIALLCLPRRSLLRSCVSGNARREQIDEAGKEVPIKPDPAGPLVAQVFKTRIDPFVQKLSYIECSRHAQERRQRACLWWAKERQNRAVVGSARKRISPDRRGRPGDIVALAKTEDLHTGTMLGNFTIPPPKYPTPMVGLAATPKSRGDEAKLSGSLHKVVEEDPTSRSIAIRRPRNS